MNMLLFKKLSIYIGCTLSTALVVAGFHIFYAPNTQAVSGNDFKAGNIIGDATFYDKDSMNPAEIQAFLNSKVPSCQSGYTCLKAYRQDTPQRDDGLGLCRTYPAGNKVAAQIIYDVAQVCGISPRVLITLLQKEQGLVTSTNPTDVKYRSATGYGCPDSAPCDAQYYGFFNQVYKAAWQYRYYQKYENTYSYRAGRTNSILWNVPTSCGRSDVYIENQVTAGLYVYTPYRPNTAALNNLYGLGDSCSAYGNRNFWRTFSDWFGIDNKSLLRTVSSGVLYYIDGTNKYIVPSMDIVSEYGLTNNDVGFVSQSSIDSIPTSTASPVLSYVLKSNSDSDDDGGDLYLVTGGKRYRITSMDQLGRFGYSGSDITYLPYFSLVRMPMAGNLSDFVQRDDGALYRVTDAKKSAIFQLDYYNQLSGNSAPSRLSNIALVRLATSTPIINGYIPLKGEDGRLWLASSSAWQYISSMQVLDCNGINSANIPSFNNDVALVGNVTGNASCFVIDPATSTTYLLNGTVKYRIEPEWGIAATTPAIDPSLLSRQATQNASALSVFKDTVTSALYTLEQGKKRYVSDMNILQEIGQTPQSILPLSSSVASLLPTGADRIASGRTIRNSTSGQLYVMNNDKKMYITNMETFYAYGFRVQDIHQMTPDTSAMYVAESSSLANVFKIDGNVYIVDQGKRYLVPPGLIADYGMQSVATYSTGVASVTPLVATATKFLKSSSSPQLYYLEQGIRRPIYSWDLFLQLGGNAATIVSLSEDTMRRYPIGSSM
ncbi:hypothetical protein A2707_04190 [Candidatus Saccharibacteria bacterium RIFCSPHIGHO2_01_FULL_45_15]|nr:MAG: hypothetical protein A2707_04190 [Candidatus Saccharibacteria bacterium RIFCSPHIGHO2_01_FULL_45_15]OGL27142.1 MAG: hypothetical protein A3C39_01090 [Candidatus Saccharibacteria bacterium RIFCSPHIGHO2_02_FULL_46_12]OGL32820.1 MAG: hypothetical protein A3E76_05770 [Candidatus Saccharibacteria bacterium RIFCSPHIGHO2_12_FULL_44_22]